MHSIRLCHAAPLKLLSNTTAQAMLCPCPALPPAAIPFIVHPIDSAVHAVLNATLRPAMRRYICQEAGGAEAGLAICESKKQ